MIRLLMVLMSHDFIVAKAAIPGGRRNGIMVTLLVMMMEEWRYRPRGLVNESGR
jgi:hypothetical protein